MLFRAHPRWKPYLILAAGLLLGVGLGLAVLIPQRSATAPGPRKLPPTVGAQAPDFLLPELGPSQPASGGTPMKLSDLRGKVVMVNFWATWCEPCKKEMPLLEATAKQHPELVILGVDAQEDEKVVRTFVEQVGVTYPILLDTTGSVSDLYFVKNFPTTFFIDSGGVLRAQHLGLLEETDLNRYLQTIGIHP